MNPDDKPTPPRKQRVVMDITDYHIQQTQQMAGYGLTVSQIAAIIGISKRCFERKCERQQELKDALIYGRARAAAMLGETVFKLAMGGSPQHARLWYEVVLRFKSSENERLRIDEEQDEIKKELAQAMILDLSTGHRVAFGTGNAIEAEILKIGGSDNPKVQPEIDEKPKSVSPDATQYIPEGSED